KQNLNYNNFLVKDGNLEFNIISSDIYIYNWDPVLHNLFNHNNNNKYKIEQNKIECKYFFSYFNNLSLFNRENNFEQLNYLFNEENIFLYDNYNSRNFNKFLLSTIQSSMSYQTIRKNKTKNFSIFDCEIDLFDEDKDKEDKDNRILIEGIPNIKLIIKQNNKNNIILKNIQDNFFSEENFMKLNNGIVLFIIISTLLLNVPVEQKIDRKSTR